jgi:hypothetical protein
VPNLLRANMFEFVTFNMLKMALPWIGKNPPSI